MPFSTTTTNLQDGRQKSSFQQNKTAFFLCFPSSWRSSIIIRSFFPFLLVRAKKKRTIKADDEKSIHRTMATIKYYGSSLTLPWTSYFNELISRSIHRFMSFSVLLISESKRKIVTFIEQCFTRLRLDVWPHRTDFITKPRQREGNYCQKLTNTTRLETIASQWNSDQITMTNERICWFPFDGIEPVWNIFS